MIHVFPWIPMRLLLIFQSMKMRPMVLPLSSRRLTLLDTNQAYGTLNKEEGNTLDQDEYDYI